METPKSGGPIPINLSINQNVKQTVSTPVNTSLEEQLEQVMNLITEDKFKTSDERGNAYQQKSKLEIELKQLSNDKKRTSTVSTKI